jgi:glutathione peroxidase
MLCLCFIFGAQAQDKNIYSFKLDGLEGNTIDFAAYKGKKILVVNVASKCGFTPQYEGLEALYKKYEGKLVIIGCPANNFMGQEPGANTEIATFCKRNYGVSFPMAAKISVKGKKMHPLYKFLTQKALNGVDDSSVQWNFQKYLIDENGMLIQHFSPNTKPLSEDITKAIEKPTMKL